MTAAGLHDRFQRRINYLRLSITDRCNLRCTYCMPAAGVSALGHGEILSYEEMLRVARVAVSLGIEKIRITGGEPLVRRGVVEFVARVGALPGLRDFSLTTNGLLLADSAAALRQAGLRRVNVSLDTLRPEVFERIARRPGLERVLAGLAEARRVGLAPIKVNVVALRGVNDGEILDFAAFAQEQACEVRFIEFMPSAAEAWEGSQVLTSAEVLAVLGSRYDLQPTENGSAAGPSRTFQLPGGGRVGVISPLSDHFCGSCNRLRLTAAGSLRSCLFSQQETDLRPLLRSAADPGALAAAIRAAVHSKPERHAAGEDELQSCGLSMSRVGG
jgi:cyclic pyranopterin phosphate synthase